MRASDSSTVADALRKALVVACLLFVFLLGVKGLGDGFKLLGRDFLEAFFSATENPFIALMIGVLATTLVQSSSVSTSMVVGLVAAPENPLPIANAIPIVMGTNIGTTVTNTAVSLAHMGRRDEFRRAFAVATCHDFFNFLSVLVLLPLELATGYLQHSAEFIASHLGGVGEVDVAYESPLRGALKSGMEPVVALSRVLFASEQAQGGLIIVVSAVLIFCALFLLVRVMRAAMQTRVEVYVTRFLDRSGLLSILVGVIVTFMVQSSSITTSLLVPLGGAGIITLEQAFPITLGANIGTTLTALIASMGTTGANAQAGIVIALVHLLFNFTGTVLIYPIAVLRRIPLRAAEHFAGIAVRSRRWAVIYVVILFYGLPAAFAFLNQYLE